MGQVWGAAALLLGVEGSVPPVAGNWDSTLPTNVYNYALKSKTIYT